MGKISGLNESFGFLLFYLINFYGFFKTYCKILKKCYTIVSENNSIKLLINR